MAIEDMMRFEGIEWLKLDKETNTLTIMSEDSKHEVGLTMDLIREFEKMAEDDSSEVFKVVDE